MADNLQLTGCPFSQFDLFTQILNGLDSEYTSIIVELLDNTYISWVEFQTSLLTFESQLEQIQSFQNLNLNTSTTNFATFTANFAATNTNQFQRYASNSFVSKNNINKNNWRGFNPNRGGRSTGRGRNTNGRPIC